jgi:arylsulfatase A
VEEDPAEKYDLAARHPDVIAALRALAARHARTVQPVESQVAKYPRR